MVDSMVSAIRRGWRGIRVCGKLSIRRFHERKPADVGRMMIAKGQARTFTAKGVRSGPDSAVEFAIAVVD